MFYFYAVKNLDTGKYLCRVPQNVNDLKLDTIWSDKPQKIKFYSIPAPARSAVTKIARLCATGEISMNVALVQFDTVENVLDETQRITKAVEKIQSANQKSRMAYNQHHIESLKRERDRIEQQLKAFGIN